MTTKASGNSKKEEAADYAADFGRLAAGMLESARELPLHQLMVHPAAAMAAATAIGFGFSTQMAGAFFGVLQGAMEATNQLAAALDETPPEEIKPAVDIEPKNIRPAPAKIAVSKAKPAPVAKKPAIEAKPASRAKKADDLKLIAGIGPKLEQVLNAKGVRTFAAIAAWTDDEIARIDADLGFDGRIARDGWTLQAKELSAKGRKRT
jgi:NADH-quinone oxidoreductase subunit E